MSDADYQLMVGHHLNSIKINLRNLSKDQLTKLSEDLEQLRVDALNERDYDRDKRQKA